MCNILILSNLIQIENSVPWVAVATLHVLRGHTCLVAIVSDSTAVGRPHRGTWDVPFAARETSPLLQEVPLDTGVLDATRPWATSSRFLFHKLSPTTHCAAPGT